MWFCRQMERNVRYLISGQKKLRIAPTVPVVLAILAMLALPHQCSNAATVPAVPALLTMPHQRSNAPAMLAVLPKLNE